MLCMHHAQYHTTAFFLGLTDEKITPNLQMYFTRLEPQIEISEVIFTYQQLRLL